MEGDTCTAPATAGVRFALGLEAETDEHAAPRRVSGNSKSSQRSFHADAEIEASSDDALPLLWRGGNNMNTCLSQNDVGISFESLPHCIWVSKSETGN
jgi:hypothetical protein